jgi:DNA-binding XRE family transcriptional regulator
MFKDIEPVEISVEDVVFVKDLYPRVDDHNSAIVAKYSESNLANFPPIIIDQNYRLIDGKHRWLAHKKAKLETIMVKIITVNSDRDFHRMAMGTNNSHGFQTTNADKKKYVLTWYTGAKGEKEEFAHEVSVSEKTISRWVSDKDKALRNERKETIRDMWMSCHTQEEIAAAVGVDRSNVIKNTDKLLNLDKCPNSTIIAAKFMDEDYKPPIYNVWAFGKKTNETAHFGNSEQRIVDNLLYLYTQPFDIVVDPFAGGGSTIDVCKRRSRRYWASDRKPIVERENEIRKHDIVTDGLPPLHKRWQDVTLTYLDPPYWRQAAGQYSDDETDLANMPLGEFHDTLGYLVEDIAEKQKTGYIALLIQPTQWKADNKQFTDHVMWLCSRVNLELENRISCPYSTEQYNAQMVNYAKENRKLLVISRELIIWKAG